MHCSDTAGSFWENKAHDQWVIYPYPSSSSDFSQLKAITQAVLNSITRNSTDTWHFSDSPAQMVCMINQKSSRAFMATSNYKAWKLREIDPTQLPHLIGLRLVGSTYEKA